MIEILQGLSREAAVEELKTFCAKTSFDFISKTMTFIRKSEVNNIFLLLKLKNSNVAAPHHGYSLPSITSSTEAKNSVFKVWRYYQQLLVCYQDFPFSGFQTSRKVKINYRGSQNFSIVRELGFFWKFSGNSFLKKISHFSPKN